MAVEVERLFREAGALLEGHFLLASGRHSPVYWEKFLILQYPSYTEKLCHMISKHFQGQGIQVVTGPTTGGIILSYEVARQLGVRGIFAESEDEKRVFRRGFSITPGERTLVVDDVLTTGGSIYEVIAEVKRQGGEVVGVGVLVDRSQKEIDFGAPLFSCYRTSVPTYAPEDCPLCADNVPLVKPGGGG
jgi:orotate phosphoribosyltransferase